MFKIDFASLRDKAELATGDAVFCAKCGAVLNVHSVVDMKTVGDKQKQIWACEFCLHDNEVDVEEEEKPKTASVNYIV